MFEDRVRFNWGYHDGAADAAAGREHPMTPVEVRHFDQVYAKGYLAGRADQEAGLYAGNSDAAWERSGLGE